MDKDTAYAITNQIIDDTMLDIFSTIKETAENGKYGAEYLNMTRAQANRLVTLGYIVENSFLNVYFVSWK